MKKVVILIALAFLFIGEQAFSQTTYERDTITTSDGDIIYLTFKLRDDVTMEPVQYQNRYGITIAAHLYLPKDIDKSKKYPAVVIGTPYGGVKEQGAGIYGMNMAERGFVAIAFDESFNGESSGEPKDVASPDFFVEDFSAGVDYLGSLDYVDRDEIGAIGICGSGGFALTAAQVDVRIKAVVTASMYDISSFIRNGLGYTNSEKDINKTLKDLSEQRWEDFENGYPKMPGMGWPKEPAKKAPGILPAVMEEFFEYYGTIRGWHPNTLDNFTLTSALSFMNFPLMSYIETISPRPIMFIMGENAHSAYFSEEAYEKAAEPKELVIIPEARHIDLYDREDMIPFDKIATFFNENLK